TYPDYNEALKEKECFTYKLGEALIKADKEWYKAGYVKFYFKDVPRLKREFGKR
ncbi:TPA: sugar transferase, partial [Campylobacter jejuni]|nr:sugar transferase [Campylobacter jejuni]